MVWLSVCHWLAATHLGVVMRESTYAFPIVEIFHLIALAIFGGSILLVDLRFLNLGFTTQPVGRVARELLPLTGGGVVAMLLTGLLMFAGGTLRYSHNPMFQWKMILFAIAVLFHFSLQVGVSRGTIADRSSPWWLRSSAVVSLLLWFSIGLAGRAIGYV